TNAVAATVTVGVGPFGGPFGLAYDSAKGEVFVVKGGAVSVISDTTNAVVATGNVGGGPFGVAYDSGMNEVFVANQGSNTVSVISDATNDLAATVGVGSRPFGVASDSARG